MGRDGLEVMARRVARSEGRRVPRPLAPGPLAPGPLAPGPGPGDGDGADGPHGSRHLPLTYVRSGPRADVPVLVVPGGPGLASVVPYRRLRRAAARRGLDVLMVEHRGVGLSRRDSEGADVPPEAVTVEDVVDDLAAVLDDAGVRRAVVYGSSYGTYLAQGFGVRHPERVAAMVLDSPLLSVEDDLDAVRTYRRRLFWDGADPDFAPVAAAVHELAEDGVPLREVGDVVQVVHEFAGPEVLLALLTARRQGRLRGLWNRLAGLGSREIDGPGLPFVLEPDLVSGIAYRQLGYGLPPDGGPLDPQLAFAAAAERYPPFGGEPFDLPTELTRFDWPTVVVSGDRDLRTPRPVAERLVGLLPDGVLLPLARTGHSALDTHQLAALHIARAASVGAVHRLPDLADRLADLPRRGTSTWIARAFTAAVRLEAYRPRPAPPSPQLPPPQPPP